MQANPDSAVYSLRDMAQPVGYRRAGLNGIDREPSGIFAEGEILPPHASPTTRMDRRFI